MSTATAGPVTPQGIEAEQVASEWSALVFLPHLVTITAALLVFSFAGPETGLRLLSLMAIGFGVGMALWTGGPSFLTPSSVMLVAAAVLVGGAGYYLGRVDSPVAMVDLRNASLLALVTTVGISLVTTGLSIAWRTSWRAVPSTLTTPLEPFTPPRHFALRGVVLMVASQLPPLESVLGALAHAMGLCGALMLTLFFASRRRRMRWEGDAILLALVVAIPLLWISLSFGGGGRIGVAGLAVAALMGWNMVRPTPWQKLVVVLAIPLFLVVAGQVRLDEGDQDESNQSVLSDGEGLASLYSPLETFGMLIEPKEPHQADRLGPRWGGTFINTLVLPLPRSLWEEKPVGFGRELVDGLDLRGVSSEHSVAALMHGEWYANFGYPGLALMTVVLGWLMALLDRAHSRLTSSRLSRPTDWWRTVVLMCVVSSIADFFWVGSFTWYARGGLAAVVAYVIGRISLRRVAP